MYVYIIYVYKCVCVCVYCLVERHYRTALYNFPYVQNVAKVHDPIPIATKHALRCFPHLANEAFGLLVQGIRGDLVAPEVVHRGFHSLPVVDHHVLKAMVTWGTPILDNPHIHIHIHIQIHIHIHIHAI